MSPLELSAPSSKSMTQRALVIAGLSAQPTTIRRPLICDDSRYLTDLWRALGAEVAWGDDQVVVTPAPLVAPADAVFCGNAGTTVRFGSCLSLICDGALGIDGDAHMRTRPIGPLGLALETMGVRVRYLGSDGCPPLELLAERPPATSIAIDTSLSSQYASGLMMVAPRLASGLSLSLTGAKVSMPYVAMTATMMRAAGASLEATDDGFAIAPGSYTSAAIEVEPDWSGAAFLLAAGFVTGLPITVRGLVEAEASLQGDAVFRDMLTQLSRPASRHRFDLTDAPDLIAPLVIACLCADAPSQIRGAAHTRVKESDRVAVLATELGKLGAELTMFDDGLDVMPFDATSAKPARLDPDDDHRMAMAFGILSLLAPDIEVASPGCVSKSFPNFWEVLASMRAAMGAPC
jgi:3-phosphoshikimate 1-carboxyvinyltransferase